MWNAVKLCCVHDRITELTGIPASVRIEYRNILYFPNSAVLQFVIATVALLDGQQRCYDDDECLQFARFLCADRWFEWTNIKRVCAQPTWVVKGEIANMLQMLCKGYFNPPLTVLTHHLFRRVCNARANASFGYEFVGAPDHVRSY